MKDSLTDKKEAPVVPIKPADSSDIAQHKPLNQEEVNGRGGLEPTRFGDWEKNGRCIDF